MTCKPRQARKGATVAVNYVPGCGWLGRHPSITTSFYNRFLSLDPIPIIFCLSGCLILSFVSISPVGRYNRRLFFSKRNFR
jgi:hypothetical protein